MLKTEEIRGSRTARHAPWWMFVLAACFLAYFALLVYCDFWGPQPIGILTEFSGGRKLVRAVFPRSPAEQVGLQIGDRVVAAEGHGIRNIFDWTPIRVNLKVGQPSRLLIDRHGSRFELALVLQRASWNDWTSKEGLVLLAVRGAQFVTLVLALVIAFSRPYDLVARVGAWLLATVATTSLLLPYGMADTWRQLPRLLGVLLLIPLASTLALAPLTLTFFAIFPRRLFRTRALWSLVWAPPILSLVTLIPYGYHMFFRPWSVGPIPEWLLIASNSAFPVYILGGLLALIVNFHRLEDVHQKRRVRVMVVGSVLGWLAVLPLFLYWWAPASKLAPSFFLSPAMILSIVLFMAFPLSFAYAVIRYRVLEIPVLLKRSARYLLVQRGFLVLVFLASALATFGFLKLYGRLVQPRLEGALPAGMAVGVGFGILLAWAGSQTEKRITPRIDRAFFRSAYDARQVLQDLAEEARKTTSREGLAMLLEHQLRQALHPQILFVYMERGNGRLSAVSDDLPSELKELSSSLPELVELAIYGKPWEVPPPEAGDASVSMLLPLKPECLVPIVGGDGRLTGLLALGPRLSEEPYSGEDKRLLTSVASQVGIALESIRLAEQMAERIEAERRVARELEIARQVQEKLFPQKMPAIKTLQVAGACIQARVVGGDYYDFLDLGPGKVAIVLADISGKGIPAALLMASLQADLRSLYALAMNDLPSLMRSVNRLLYESTAPEHYATLFFARYQEESRRLCYANCGHLPPFLLRADGSGERLEATATVLGLFDNWECTVRQVEFGQGDTLVAFSDGVTDAVNDQVEEFGENRLLGILRDNSELAVQSLLDTVISTVQQFSGCEQADDLTLVVARSL